MGPRATQFGIPPAAAVLYVRPEEFLTLRENNQWPEGLHFNVEAATWHVAPDHPRYGELVERYGSEDARRAWEVDRIARDAVYRRINADRPWINPKNRAYLYVPPEHVDEVRRLGAQYDKTESRWFVARNHPRRKQLEKRFTTDKARGAWEKARQARIEEAAAKRQFSISGATRRAAAVTAAAGLGAAAGAATDRAALEAGAQALSDLGRSGAAAAAPVAEGVKAGVEAVAAAGMEGLKGIAAAGSESAAAVEAAAQVGAASIFNDLAAAKLLTAGAALGLNVGVGAFAGTAVLAGLAGASWYARRKAMREQWAESARETPWMLTPRQFGQVAKSLYAIERRKDGTQHVAELRDRETGAILFTAADDRKISARDIVVAAHRTIVDAAARQGAYVPPRVLEGHEKEAARGGRTAQKTPLVAAPESGHAGAGAAAGAESAARAAAAFQKEKVPTVRSLPDAPRGEQQALEKGLKGLSDAQVEASADKTARLYRDRAASLGRSRDVDALAGGLGALGAEIEARAQRWSRERTQSRTAGAER